MAVTCSCGFQLISQDVANNTSTVDFVIWYTTTYGSYNHNGCPSSRTFGGNLSGTASWTGTLDLKQTNREYRRERLTVNHNADGTASISASVAIDTQVSSGTIYASTSLPLPTIARASQPSCVTYPNNTEKVGDLGKAITIHMNRASSSFTHTVTYQFGESSGTIATGVTDNCAWTMPLALANQMPNATSGWGTITVKTYNGGTLIGTKTCRFSPTVPTSVVPTISSVTPSDTAGYRTTYGAYVQNKSNFRVVTVSAGAYSSTIKTVAVTIGGVTVNGSTANFGVRGFVGSQTVTVKVTDSRGRTATKTTSTTWVAYSSPNLSKCWAKRWSGSTENDESATVRYHIEGSVTNVNNTGTNKATVKIEYKLSTASTWTLYNTQSNGLSFNYNKDQSGFNTNLAYDVRITCTDVLGTVTEALYKIDTAKPVMDFLATGNGMAIGGVATKTGVLETKYTIQPSNGMTGIYGQGYHTDANHYFEIARAKMTTDYSGSSGWIRVHGKIGGYSCASYVDVIIPTRNFSANGITLLEKTDDRGGICDLAVYLDSSNKIHVYVIKKISQYWAFNLFVEGHEVTCPLIDMNTVPSGTCAWLLSDNRACIYNHTALKNGIYLQGELSSGGKTNILGVNTSNQVELNWTTGGLRGRCMKKLWSGTANLQGTITIPEAPYYNVFSLRIYDWTTALIGLRLAPETPSFVRFYGMYDNSAKHEAYIASFNLDDATGTKWTYLGGCLDRFNGTAEALNGISNIYGIL